MSAGLQDWAVPIATDARIRPLHRSDVTAASSVVARAFGSEELGLELAEQLLIYCDAGLDALPLDRQREGLPREYYAIASRGSDEVIGIAGLYRLGLWTWSGILWLGWFAVGPERQRTGLGSAALACVMRLARSRAAEVLKVETRAGGPATAFYARHGFTEEAILRDHYGPGVDAQVMRRSLADVEPLPATGEPAA